MPPIKPEWLAPTLLATVVLGVVLAARPTLDGHEVLVAQTAREMIASGDFLHPTFAGESRLQKPPLAYWACVFSFLAFGENETAARLPAALAAVIGVALTAVFARRAFGPGMGRLAGCVQATSLWTVAYGRLALVDPMLATLVTAAMLVAAWDRLGRVGSEMSAAPPSPFAPRKSALMKALYLRRNFRGAKGNGEAVLFWVLCGLIALAKGPVGLAMLWPPVIGYRWLRGKRETDVSLVRRPAALVGIALFLVLALAWPIEMLRRYPEAWAVWTGQSLGRFQEHYGPQTRPWWYFFVQMPWLLFPWSVPLAVVLVRRPRVDLRDPHQWLLLLWLGTAFVLCTCSAGKRAHYILPGLPAASVIAALAVRRLAALAFDSRGVGDDKNGLALPPHPTLPRGGGRGCIVGARRWVVISVCLVALVEAAVYAGVVAPGQDLRGLREMAARNRKRLENMPVVQVGSRERATVFPINRPLLWLAEPPVVERPTLVLTPEKNVPELLKTGRATVIDRAGPKRSRAERSAAAAMALVELRPLR